MTIRTVTVELSEKIYKRAEQIAQATQRPIEQIVVEWIHPPFKEDPADAIGKMENLPNDKLIRIARTNVPTENSRRLQKLLNTQQQRDLTESEQQEAADLVEQEDLVTLQKARAIFLLKQRKALPDDLATLLT